MGGLLSYSLSVSVFILMLYPVLHQIINRSRHFRFNRLAVITGLLLSLALPCVLDATIISLPSVPDVVNLDSIIKTDSTLSETPATGEPSDSITTLPWLSIVLLVYLSGIVVLSFREIISFLRLFRMIAVSEKKRIDGVTVCRITDNDIAPLSWGNYIFLHDTEFDNSSCIYIHEKAHTDRLHWIDVLFADLFCIILWYNPFAWMTRQLMKLNHEFEADEAVISSGIGTYDYQRLLVVKAMVNRSITIANSFAADKRSFRKRVLIMSKKRPSKKTMLIALCAIPTVALAGAALSMPVPSRILSEISDYSFRKELLSEETQSDYVSKDVRIDSEQTKPESETLTVIPSPFEDQAPLAEIIRLSVETIQPDKDTKVNIEIVVDEDGRVKDVSSDTPEGAEVAAAISQKFNGIRLEQITDNGKPIEIRFVVPVQLRIKK
ncbi:MAG: M56 family metallopeptidase [Duncaniella sp.]|nr:M56 family metallopeptidase [Duncaniella sp.]